MIEPLRLVVFDVDGTLVDSQADIVSSMTQAFELAGRDVPPRDTILHTVGLSLPQMMRSLAPQASAADQDALVRAYKTACRNRRVAAGSKARSPL